MSDQKKYVEIQICVQRSIDIENPIVTLRKLNKQLLKKRMERKITERKRTIKKMDERLGLKLENQ